MVVCHFIFIRFINQFYEKENLIKLIDFFPFVSSVYLKQKTILTMENIPRAIKEFNEFRYKPEEIFTKSKWEGDWEDGNVVLLIWAEYVCENEEDVKKCHINYCDKYWGSKRFNEWLDKYNFTMEWQNSAVVNIYLKKRSKT